MKKSPIALIGARLSKRFLFAATAMAVCMGVTYAAALIDPADLGEGDWQSLLITLGFFAAIQCHEHKDLIRFAGVTESIEVICKWLFRGAIVFLIVPIICRLVGWHLTEMSDAGGKLLTAWSVLRSAQALYLSGVTYGMHNSTYIFKRLQEPPRLD